MIRQDAKRRCSIIHQRPYCLESDSLMVLFRPILPTDREKIMTFVFSSSERLSSMPKDRKFLNHRLDTALATWHNPKAVPVDERLFLFALEEQGQLLGFCGIKSQMGENHLVLQLPTEPDSPYEWTTLDPQASQLCSLFLDPWARHSGLGKALSFGRFFYLRAHPEWFHAKLLAQLNGWSLRSGHCPFWTTLARISGSRKAQTLDFASVHHLVATGHQKLQELFDRPLPTHAAFSQQVAALIGHAHEHTLPAEQLLLELGFEKTPMIDPLDAGPYYGAPIEGITLYRHMLTCRVDLAHDVVIGQLGWIMLCPTLPKEHARFGVHVLRGWIDRASRKAYIASPLPKEIEPGSYVDAFSLDALEHPAKLFHESPSELPLK